MENPKNLPLNTKLSSDDLLVTFCELFGQSDELMREWFPIFEFEDKLSFTIEVEKGLEREVPEGALLDRAYNITVKNESNETMMVVYMKPTENPDVVTFAWDILDEKLNDDLKGVPVQFKL